MRWEPDEYSRYQDERQRPLRDLLARIPTLDARRVVDLGCGTGGGTVVVSKRWPQADVVGIDSSDDMLAEALRSQEGSIRFVKADIAGWTPEPSSVDVIFSNAALHWIPGHAGFFGSWMRGLTEGGSLAFQVPGNFDAPSHTLLADLAASDKWRRLFAGKDPANRVHSPYEYYSLLRVEADTVDVWETTYYHRLDGEDPVFKWVRATALRPYVEALPSVEAPAFVESYRKSLREAYPREPSGETVFPFRRIFAVATGRR